MPIDAKHRKICDDLKPYLPQYLKDTGLWDGKSPYFRCPFHLLPQTDSRYHEDHNPSAHIIETGEKWVCYGCGPDRTYDIMDIAVIVEHPKPRGNLKKWTLVLDLLANRYLGKKVCKPQKRKPVQKKKSKSAVAQKSAPVTDITTLMNSMALNTQEQQLFTSLMEQGKAILDAGYKVVIAYPKAEEQPTGEIKIKKAPFASKKYCYTSSHPIENIETLLSVMGDCIKMEGLENTYLSICLTGSDLVCIDIDQHNKNEDGAASFKALINGLGQYPPTIIEETKNGGCHLFYRIPKGVQVIDNSEFFARTGLKGIEILSGTRYICTYPSSGYSDVTRVNGPESGYDTRDWSNVPLLTGKWLTLLDKNSNTEEIDIIRESVKIETEEQMKNGIVLPYKTGMEQAALCGCSDYVSSLF